MFPLPIGQFLSNFNQTTVRTLFECWADNMKSFHPIQGYSHSLDGKCHCKGEGRYASFGASLKWWKRGNENCCEAGACGEEEGDCDNDAQCASGLVCGLRNCLWSKWKHAWALGPLGQDDCCTDPGEKNFMQCRHWTMF